jgi:hypothetical protein
VDEVLTRTAHILVRELEMEGALFLDAATAEPIVSWGGLPCTPYENCPRFPLISREDRLLAELVVAPPEGGALSLYERDFIEGLVLQTAVALENATLHERDVEWRGCSRTSTRPGRFSGRCCPHPCRRSRGFRSARGLRPAMRWAATISTS